MFVLEIKNAIGKISRHYWMNPAEDDFLRYIPKNFGVSKDAIRAWIFSDDDFPLLEGLMKSLEGQGVLDLSTDGKIKAGRIARTETQSEVEGEAPVIHESFELLAEYEGHEVEWPYSSEWKMSKPELGTFLGWQRKE
jgi:hypothetical protein